MRVSGHLLVVDDAPESLKLMVATLERDGHRVRPADSGELALAAIAHERPELILLDLRMPGFGGLALCDYLKADPILKNISYFGTCGRASCFLITASNSSLIFGSSLSSFSMPSLTAISIILFLISFKSY